MPQTWDGIFSDQNRDPGHVWPRAPCDFKESQKNRSRRRPKIEKWKALIDAEDVIRERKYTKEQAALLVATHVKGSMRRQNLFLTCYISGIGFTAEECTKGAEKREALVREELSAIGVPADVIRFTPPSTDPPVWMAAEDMQGSAGEQYKAEASQYSAEALQNWRASMEAVIVWARQNLPDGQVQVNRATAQLRQQLKGVSNTQALRIPKVELHYPSKEERKRLFGQIDANGNGYLSLAELDLAVKTRWPEFDHKNAVIRAYKLADRKNEKDGWLTRSDVESRCEWSHFLKYLELYNRYWQRFAILDLNSDLSIDRGEWQLNANTCFELSGDDALSPEELDVVFQDLDHDRSGKVRFDEFCIWAAKVNGELELAGSDNLVQRERAPAPSRMGTLRKARQSARWNQNRAEGGGGGSAEEVTL